MTISTEEELEGLRSAGHVVADVLRRMCHAAEPGMTTAELDALGAKWLAEAGADPPRSSLTDSRGPPASASTKKLRTACPGPESSQRATW